MAKRDKTDWRKAVWMIVYWAIFLTVTMALFERFGIVPHNVPLGVFGWTVFVELPRVIVGFLISLIFSKFD
jgi:hypothetical protein